MALNQACGQTQRWYTSTKELQLASLPFCAACRNVTTLRLKVNATTPSRLLAAANPAQPQSEDQGPTRVPQLRARAVLWERRSVAELNKPLKALVDVERFAFWYFNASITSVAWPSNLRELFLGWEFNHPIEPVVLPRSLQRLDFGAVFNQPIESMAWPESLQRIKFGWNFNQPIQSVRWPASILTINFGERFNQPIASVAWPASLEDLRFGEFNQPIEPVVWPGGLQSLDLGWEFNQPIESVVWPAGLQQLQLGRRFNQPVTRVIWPASLQSLRFGQFDCDLDRYDSCFDQPIDKAVWPASLRKVEFGECFRHSVQGLGTWMPNLEELELVANDYSFLCDMEWPKGLKILHVDMRSFCDIRDRRSVPPNVKLGCGY